MFFYKFPKRRSTPETIERLLPPELAEVVNGLEVSTELSPVIFYRAAPGAPLQLDAIATHYIAHEYHGSARSTKQAVASSLCGWFNFLAGRHPVRAHKSAPATGWEPLPHPWNNRTPKGYLDATQGDFGAWQGYQQAHLASATRQKNQTFVKGFEDWLLANQHIKKSPVRTKTVQTQHGPVQKTVGPRPVKSASTSRLPFTPEEVRDLRAALATPSGAGTAAGQVRDPAIVRFMTATGVRLKEAMYLTTYEIPPPNTTGNFFVPFTVPGALTKSHATRVSDVAQTGLDAARNYIAGDRQDVIDNRNGKPWKPKKGPAVIPIDENRTDAKYVTLLSPYTQQWTTFSWADVDADTRKLLVNADGQPICIWLTRHGSPLRPDTFRATFKAAVLAVHATHPTVGPGTHVPHSLRHTFAVMKATWLWKTAAYPVPHSAVDFVQLDLGHASQETTTRTYLAGLNRLRNHTANDIEWGF